MTDCVLSSVLMCVRGGAHMDCFEVRRAFIFLCLDKVLSGVFLRLEGCNVLQWEIYRKGNCKLCVLVLWPLFNKNYLCKWKVWRWKANSDKIRCFQRGCRTELADVLSLQRGPHKQKLLMALRWVWAAPKAAFPWSHLENGWQYAWLELAEHGRKKKWGH